MSLKAELMKRYSPSKITRLLEYHRTNPHVYKEFKDMAFKIKSTGRKKYSARTVVEVMRWRSDIKTHSDDFKISNDFTPMYVRILIYYYPSFKDFFDLKEAPR